MNSSPECPDSHRLTSPPQRRAKSSIGDRSTPDSIEEAASFLFNRVRALISPTEDRNAGKSSKDVERENENQRSESPAGATPSYYGDHEGESNDSESLHTARDRTPVPGGGTMNIEPKQDNGYQSSDPDLDSVVRIGTVAQKSVASSIVRDPGSHFGRPHFSHASIPADIGRVGLQKRMKNRSLGLMTPSPTASGVGVVGSLAEGSSSEDEGDEEATSGGIDPETIRRKVLSRPVFEPIRATDPIVRVVYDDSSSAPASCRGSPDLFARPLYLGSPIKRNPDTPTNTIATPPPLIGIFPATDSSNSPYSLISDDSRQRAARTPTPPSQSPTPPSQSPSPPIRSTIGHTGASTPEDGVLGTATVNRGTMTDFDYDEYAEDEYGPPGVSVMPSNMGTPLGNSSRTDLEARSHEGNIQSSRSSNAFGALSSYCDSDPQVMTRPATVSLHQAYTRQGSPKEFNTTSAIRAMLRSRAGSPVVSKAQVREDGTVAPVSSQSFTRIITDLEEMLNQALELAGRAVQDSSSALNQRDASVRSLQSSTRGSLISSGFGGTDRAVTAPESIAGPGEDTRPIDQEYYAPPKMQIAQQDANMSSSTAVYSDNGDPTSRSNVSFNGERRAKSVPPKQPPLQKIDLAESEKERSWRGYLDPSDSISKPTKKSNIQKRSFNAQSTVSSDPEQRFRMEVGRDGEIILVRIHAEKPSQPAAGSSVPGEGGVVQGQAPRRYNGGWEWGLWGKRFAVSVACGVVGLIGWIIGSYAAELPKIQEHLSISSEIATLGNSMFFLGLAIPTLLFWPLPLLHGRKPYLLLSISLLLPLQLPQALSLPPYTKNPTSWNRSMEPYVACLLFFRTVSGVILGFAFMNSMATIIDVFGPDTGACCRGGVVYNNRIPLEGHDQYNAIPGGEAGVRMGIWVGVFTWLLVASPCLGYLFGKITISRTTPAWGFWTVAILAGFLLISIIIAPEVRPPWKKIRIVPVRNASRRSRTTMIAGPETVEKGEIRMVMFGSPPNWWWEEVSAGVSLTLRMLQQYGFLVVAIYFGWVFGHIVVVITV